MEKMAELLISLVIALLLMWLIIASVAFFDLANLECVKYSEWEKTHEKKQERECILYQKTQRKNEKADR